MEWLNDENGAISEVMEKLAIYIVAGKMHYERC